tara:strand:+ start:1800 stop:2552 length:753 start_codon:yes stop_codon:yes gene_type:complete
MKFSYNEYKNIIDLIKYNIPIKDFADINEKTNMFCVIRHDIEFSLDRAYKLAEIEKKLGINSTYTVQLRNNTYNALSDKNISLILKIQELGHKIGLHICPNLLYNKDEVVEEILKEADTFKSYYGFEIDRFAFHRPNLKPEILEWYLKVPGLINCNGRNYFEFFYKGENKSDNLEVTYLSDSNHQWKFGHPVHIDFSKVKKLQINTHPFSWTETGFENYGNFLSLIKERNNEMLYDINLENKAFPKELLL